MKKQRFIGITVIMAFVFSMAIFSIQARAKENAVFHVQSAEVKEDGTISVSVYLTDTADVGGIDAELVYDASKVIYVGSGLGNSFLDGYGETTHMRIDLSGSKKSAWRTDVCSISVKWR